MLYVIQQEDYSGAEILNLAVMTADPDALLACPPGSRVEEWAHSNGIVTTPLPFRSIRHSAGSLEALRSVARGLLGALELRRILKREPARRIVYGTSIRPSMLAAVAATGLGRRVVWVVTDFPPPRPVSLLTRTAALVGCARALPLSHAIADRFIAGSRRLGARTEVIHPGVDPGRFAPARDPGKPVAGLLGHISPTKRTALAVDIAERVIRAAPEFELRVVGRAQYRDEDRRLEAELRARVVRTPALRERVHFDGYVTDVRDVLSELGLLLHTRPDEPFGMALIEAMAAGLPVVAPAAAGPLEIVVHGKTGFLFDPGDADEAAAHVLSLVRDPELARRMGATGCERVADRFTIAGQVAGVERVLAGL
ncbi:MAG: glycosyltransferase family 4 protein [Thermoleophilaceae bacterium]|nr:glycosyltransferase family 4 protein [Thermoleophilaceae bacterium]